MTDLSPIVAAMTPCMRLYTFLGTELAASQWSGHPYQEWITTYSSDEFAVLTDQLESLLDSSATDTPTVRDTYRYAMRCELDFFSAPFPRAIIEGKPASIEIDLTRRLFNPNATWGIAFGGIGEMFYNFSYAGVLIWCTFVGWLLAVLNHLLLKSVGEQRLLLFSMVLSSPFFLNGWNMGINVSTTRHFVISYLFILLNIRLQMAKALTSEAVSCSLATAERN